MNQITPATTTTPASSAPASTGTDPLLNKDAFLQLMMAQLEHQDPLNSSDPTQYVTELAQFTSLEQQTNTAQSAAQTASEQQTASAVALLGHTVTYVDSSGARRTGLVQKIEISASGPTLTVAGIAGVALSSVSEVS
jgi:flagellar basal-body rod modification protein FlgD